MEITKRVEDLDILCTISTELSTRAGKNILLSSILRPNLILELVLAVSAKEICS